MSQFLKSLALRPGTNLSSAGPSFRKDRYPTSLSSSFPDPNLARIAFTAGGGPALAPSGAGFISNDPTDVSLISSSADSNTNRVGILATASRSHSTWSKSNSRDPKNTSAPSSAAATASRFASTSRSENTASSTPGHRFARFRAARRYSFTLKDSNPEMSTMRRVSPTAPASPSGATTPSAARADAALAAASRAALAAASAAATAPPPLFATAASACTAAFCATTRSRCSFAMCAFRWNASHFDWSPLCAASRSADAAGALAAASARKDASSTSFGHAKDSVRGSSPSPPGVSPRAPVEEGTCTTRSAKVALYAASRSRVSEASRSARRATSSSSAATISSGLSGATAASTSTPSRSSCSRRKRSALLSVSTGSLSARGVSATRRRALEANANPDRSPRTGRTAPRPRCRFVLTSEESEARADGVATGRAAIALAVIARMSPASAR